MLQQTQVERVVTKYAQFLTAFPDFASLARADLHEVLKVWQGMGYNRRALALRETALRVMRDFNGTLPDDVDSLATLPGIGRATGSAVRAFAFNKPSVFVETNIRRVFLSFFFKHRSNVTDSEILPLVEKTLYKRSPRIWYSALMDYGVYLKRRFPELNKRVAGYQKQSPFQGSNRQMRGKVLRELVKNPATEPGIARILRLDTVRVREILEQLLREGFIVKKRNKFAVAG